MIGFIVISINTILPTTSIIFNPNVSNNTANLTYVLCYLTTAEAEISKICYLLLGNVSMCCILIIIVTLCTVFLYNASVFAGFTKRNVLAFILVSIIVVRSGIGSNNSTVTRNSGDCIIYAFTHRTNNRIRIDLHIQSADITRCRLNVMLNTVFIYVCRFVH